MAHDTEPLLYEKIADLIIACREEKEKRSEAEGYEESKKYKEELFKMYKTIIDLHGSKGTLNDDIRKREKSKVNINSVN